jgi:hypothetical protein
MHSTKFYHHSFHSTPTCFDVSAVILRGCTKVFNVGKVYVVYSFAAFSEYKTSILPALKTLVHPLRMMDETSKHVGIQWKE